MSVIFDWFFGIDAAMGDCEPFISFADFGAGIIKTVEQIGADGD